MSNKKTAEFWKNNLISNAWRRLLTCSQVSWPPTLKKELSWTMNLLVSLSDISMKIIIPESMKLGTTLLNSISPRPNMTVPMPQDTAHETGTTLLNSISPRPNMTVPMPQDTARETGTTLLNSISPRPNMTVPMPQDTARETGTTLLNSISPRPNMTVPMPQDTARETGTTLLNSISPRPNMTVPMHQDTARETGTTLLNSISPRPNMTVPMHQDTARETGEYTKVSLQKKSATVVLSAHFWCSGYNDIRCAFLRFRTWQDCSIKSIVYCSYCNLSPILYLLLSSTKMVLVWRKLMYVLSASYNAIL